MLHVSKPFVSKPKIAAGEDAAARSTKVPRDMGFADQEAALRPGAGEAEGTGKKVDAAVTDQGDEERETSADAMSEDFEPDEGESDEEEERVDEDAAALADAIRSAPTTSGFAEASRTFLAAYDGLQLDKLALDMRARVAAMAQLRGVQFESYGDVVCNNDMVKLRLAELEMFLSQQGHAGDADDVRQTINDMLLHASIVPVHYQERKTGRTQRLAAEALSPDAVAAAIDDIKRQLKAGKQGSDADSVRGASEAEDDETPEQRILRLSLINMRVDEREALLDSPLFETLKASDDLLLSLLGASGGDEQRFMNTCTMSALNQEIYGKIGNIAGLLQVGQRACDTVLTNLGQADPKVLGATWNWGLGWRKTYEARVRGEVLRVQKQLAEIEEKATALTAKGADDVSPYHELTREWSLAMQRLGAVMDPKQRASKLPIPTPKKIDEHWHLSLLPGTAKMLSHRRSQRMEGVDQLAAVKTMGESLTLPSQGDIATAKDKKTNKTFEYMPAPKVDKLPKGPGALPRMKTLWKKVFDRGGVQVGTSGHSLFVKAVRQGGEDVFLVGDPMTSDHRPYGLEEFSHFIRSKGVRFPFTV